MCGYATVCAEGKGEGKGEGKSSTQAITSTNIPSIDLGVAFYRILRSLYERHGNKAAFDFADGYVRKASATTELEVEARHKMMKEVMQATAKRYRTDKGKAKYVRDVKSAATDAHLAASTHFALNTGVVTSGAAAVVNGVVLQGASLDEHNLQYLLQTQMVELQRMTYFGQLQEDKDIYTQYINHGGAAHKRFHKLIVPGRQASTQMLHITKAAATGKTFVAQMARLPQAVCGQDTGRLRAVTHIVATDMATKEGCDLVQQVSLHPSTNVSTNPEALRPMFQRNNLVGLAKAVIRESEGDTDCQTPRSP
jgi:hypothetical protein